MPLPGAGRWFSLLQPSAVDPAQQSPTLLPAPAVPGKCRVVEGAGLNPVESEEGASEVCLEEGRTAPETEAVGEEEGRVFSAPKSSGR